MKIRRATPDDIPALIALERNAVTAAHWNRESYARLFADVEPQRLVLVTEAEAGVQGFLVGRAGGSEWEIENMAIAGPVRRRGWGTRLLAEFLDQARAEGAAMVLLEVRESNHAARALYESRGFVENGRRQGYYRDPGEDAILYRISLT